MKTKTIKALAHCNIFKLGKEQLIFYREAVLNALKEVNKLDKEIEYQLRLRLVSAEVMI